MTLIINYPYIKHLLDCGKGIYQRKGVTIHIIRDNSLNLGSYILSYYVPPQLVGHVVATKNTPAMVESFVDRIRERYDRGT